MMRTLTALSALVALSTIFLPIASAAPTCTGVDGVSCCLAYESDPRVRASCEVCVVVFSGTGGYWDPNPGSSHGCHIP
jgi:hypothetical protein